MYRKMKQLFLTLCLLMLTQTVFAQQKKDSPQPAAQDSVTILQSDSTAQDSTLAVTIDDDMVATVT